MNPETFLKAAPFAYKAICDHMVEHQLPAPMSIDIHPGYHPGDRQGIEVRLINQQSHTPWVNSVVIDAEVNSSMSHPSAGFRTQWTVHLPESGVVFDLIGYRTEPFLTSVSA